VEHQRHCNRNQHRPACAPRWSSDHFFHLYLLYATVLRTPYV